MATENNLPNSDSDLILAQKIGAKLNIKSPFSDIKDPLIDQLWGYKEQEYSSIKVSTSVRESIWGQIEAETKIQPAKITPFYARSSTFAWASAAVLLIAAFIGFYWITQPPQLELVATSGPDIEIITLDDGSLVTLRPNSKLHRKSTRKKTRSYTLEGEAFFDVVSDPNIPFSVDGTEGTVTVLGTKFNLSTWGDKTMVYLEEGRVSFEAHASGESLILTPGQSSQVFNQGSIELLSETRSEEFTDWISGVIVFTGNSPEEVINELNQHYGVTINIDQLKNRTGLDGSLQLDSLIKTLDDLGLVLGGTFRQLSTTEFEFVSME